MIDKENTYTHLRDEIEARIAAIDKLINLQLNKILHHPEFKELEAAWRGLSYLVNEVDPGLTVKIKVLSVKKRELAKDLVKEFDESEIYHKTYTAVYEDNYQTPFGMLIGAYEFTNYPQDIFILEKMSKISALVHAPFITAASPEIFGMDTMEEIYENIRNVSRIFETKEFTRWRNFRKSETSRYVGLCLPHILLPGRQPVNKSFNFQESITVPGGNSRAEIEGLVWGNAAFAFGACVAKAYKENNWLGKMLRVDGDGKVKGDGKIKGLYYHNSGSKEGVPFGFSLDANFWRQAEDLSSSGFMPLIEIPVNSEVGFGTYFYSTNPVFEPDKDDSKENNFNSQAWTHMEYTFAASRFAVYLMCIWLDRIGTIWNWHKRHTYYLTREQWERLLQSWLDQYILKGDEADEETRALRPLREASVQLVEIPNKPDVYQAILDISPVYQLDYLPFPMRIVIHLPDVHWNKRVTD